MTEPIGQAHRDLARAALADQKAKASPEQPRAATYLFGYPVRMTLEDGHTLPVPLSIGGFNDVRVDTKALTQSIRAHHQASYKPVGDPITLSLHLLGRSVRRWWRKVTS